MADPAAVQLGPGELFVAPLGTAEPASASATLDAAFRAVGYTEEGNQFSYEVSTENVEVAEELDPVKIVTTGRSASVAFAMAELTRRNLALALNAGANAANDATGFEPPAVGSEVRVMLVFDADSGARWVFRQCFQSGTVEIGRRKAPGKALIGVEFRLEKPTGAQPFKVWPAAGGLL